MALVQVLQLLKEPETTEKVCNSVSKVTWIGWNSGWISCNTCKNNKTYVVLIYLLNEN
jgi:hypothetical protein